MKMYRVTLTNTFRPRGRVALVFDGSGYVNVQIPAKKQVFRIYEVQDPSLPLTEEYLVATNATKSDETSFEYARMELGEQAISATDYLSRLENPRQPRPCIPA